MPTAAAPIRFSRLERLEAKASYLRAKIAESEVAIRYARQGRRYKPLCRPCGHREMEIALGAVRRHGIGFDAALDALRAGE